MVILLLVSAVVLSVFSKCILQFITSFNCICYFSFSVQSACKVIEKKIVTAAITVSSKP